MSATAVVFFAAISWSSRLNGISVQHLQQRIDLQFAEWPIVNVLLAGPLFPSNTAASTGIWTGGLRAMSFAIAVNTFGSWL